jgi:hypothetical protein
MYVSHNFIPEIGMNEILTHLEGRNPLKLRSDPIQQASVEWRAHGEFARVFSVEGG